MTTDKAATTSPAVGLPLDARVVPPVPARDVLDELRDAAERKWQGNPDAQRAGLFARGADEIERLRVALDRAALALENAQDTIADWGAYASDYFKRKHDLDGSIESARVSAVAARDALRHNVGVQPPAGGGSAGTQGSASQRGQT